MNTVVFPKASLSSASLPSVLLKGEGEKTSRADIVPGKTIIIKCASSKIGVVLNGVSNNFNVEPNELSYIVINERVNSLDNAFEDVTDVSLVDLSNIELENISVSRAFRGCRKLGTVNVSTIDFSNLALVNGISPISATFSNCTSLKDLDFGTGLKVDINLGDCPLSHESALSVLNGLATVEQSRTVVFRGSVYDTLTDDDKAIATGKGWTVDRYPFLGPDGEVGFKIYDWMDYGDGGDFD